jgi:hypothetical protein
VDLQGNSSEFSIGFQETFLSHYSSEVLNTDSEQVPFTVLGRSLFYLETAIILLTYICICVQRMQLQMSVICSIYLILSVEMLTLTEFYIESEIKLPDTGSQSNAW